MPATILAHPAVDRILESATRTADELVKLNAAMDRLMIATGDGVIPAVRKLADQLITFLDSSAGWDEREEDGDEKDDDGDLNEATLGAPDATMDQEYSWKLTGQEGEDLEGDELDTHEGSSLDIDGESDCEGRSGTVDDEPSLGSLHHRMDQTKWGQRDYTPKGVWGVPVDAEDDGLVGGEDDDADKEGGIEDLPHDEMEVGEIAVTISMENADDAFGSAG